MSSIVPVNLVVKALRDSGYKNTAYAIAELIDNSIQHSSKNVDFICLEEDIQIGTRVVSRIASIAILDDGSGMDNNTLEKALQFGNGTNLDKSNQKSIGKFGMGLPSSSISQSKRVDVYTWTNGKENSIYSYLDVDDIINGKLTEVPKPTLKVIPDEFNKLGLKYKKTGTLVVWSNIDRCLWKTGKTIIEHSESIIGRMYRKFISSGQVVITARVFKKNALTTPILQKNFLPNDPMYLMTNTTVSKILKDSDIADPMFDYWGGKDNYEREYKIFFDNQEHLVYVRYSVAKEEARKSKSTTNAGSLKHGTHAGENIGVSILRSGRELDLDTTWANNYDTRERWWGVEIEFPPSLDEVFGVTNNKQYANNFRELGKIDITNTVKELGMSIGDYKKELLLDNDLKGLLIEIAADITNQLGDIRRHIKSQAKKLERTETDDRHGENKKDKDVEEIATKITENRKIEGRRGISDEDEDKKSDEQKLIDLIKSFGEDLIPDGDDVAKMLIKSNLKYQFLDTNFDGNAFFTVSVVGGKIIIKLNNSHPAYFKFVEVINDEIDENADKENIIQRLKSAQQGLKLILMAWARYEDEQPDGVMKNNVKNARQDWGRMAAEFME
jgi:hypothetical protein